MELSDRGREIIMMNMFKTMDDDKIEISSESWNLKINQVDALKIGKLTNTIH